MLYAFGSNGSGQLGVGHTEDLCSPKPVSWAQSGSTWQTRQLAAGGNHTVILCDDGKVRACGNNDDGRCGLEGLRQTSQPTEVVLPTGADGKAIEVKQVAATWSSTTLLSMDGKVYTCGSGGSGELGLGPNVTTSPKMQQMPAFPPVGSEVIYLASSMAHTVAVLSNRQIWGWGKGRKGQIDEPADDAWWPRKMKGIQLGVNKTVCGKDFTFMAGETFTGQISMSGPNGQDRFGLQAGTPLAMPGWIGLAASWGNMYILKASGDLVAWGRDDHGQLPPLGLPEVEAIAAGSEHCLVRTRAKKVLVWGWGEHGNCGTPTGEKGDVKGGWNEIQVPGEPLRVFAGCATSFVEASE